MYVYYFKFVFLLVMALFPEKLFISSGFYVWFVSPCCKITCSILMEAFVFMEQVIFHKFCTQLVPWRQVICIFMKTSWSVYIWSCKWMEAFVFMERLPRHVTSFLLFILFFVFSWWTTWTNMRRWKLLNPILTCYYLLCKMSNMCASFLLLHAKIIITKSRWLLTKT